MKSVFSLAVVSLSLCSAFSFGADCSKLFQPLDQGEFSPFLVKEVELPQTNGGLAKGIGVVTNSENKKIVIVGTRYRRLTPNHQGSFVVSISPYYFPLDAQDQTGPRAMAGPSNEDPVGVIGTYEDYVVRTSWSTDVPDNIWVDKRSETYARPSLLNRAVEKLKDPIDYKPEENIRYFDGLNGQTIGAWLKNDRYLVFFKRGYFTNVLKEIDLYQFFGERRPLTNMFEKIRFTTDSLGRVIFHFNHDYNRAYLAVIYLDSSGIDRWVSIPTDNPMTPVVTRDDDSNLVFVTVVENDKLQVYRLFR